MSEVLKTEQLNKIREIVRKMVRERMIDEMNTTDSVEGYNTPYAFSGKDSEKKKAKRQADLTGYSVVNETHTSFVSGNSGRTITHLDNKKYQLTKDVKGAQIGNYNNVVLPKGSVIHNLPGGVFVQHSSLKDKFTGIKEVPKLGMRVTTKPDTLISIEKSSKILEIVNENRWLDLKRDETRTPSQKVSHGIREVKNQLAEIERFVNWYNRLRSENNLGKNDFFKRTNTNIYRIKERIIKIASSIQEIDKAESDTNIEEVEGTKPMALDKYVVTATPKGASKDADRRTITKPAPKNSAQSQLKSLTKMNKYQSVRLKKA